jgi:hypothetical protein
LNLKDCRDAYQELSGKASDLARTLSLSGIAIIWVFKNDTPNGPIVPQELFRPGFLVVLALAFDLFQYLSGAVAWGAFGRIQELRGVSPNQNFKAPRWINWPTNLAFYAKFFSVAGAYWYLLVYLMNRFVP